MDERAEARELPPAAAGQVRLLLAQLKAAQAGLAAYLRGCRDAMGLAGQWSFSEKRMAFVREPRREAPVGEGE